MKIVYLCNHYTIHMVSQSPIIFQAEICISNVVVFVKLRYCNPSSLVNAYDLNRITDVMIMLDLNETAQKSVLEWHFPVVSSSTVNFDVWIVFSQLPMCTIDWCGIKIVGFYHGNLIKTKAVHYQPLMKWEVQNPAADLNPTVITWLPSPPIPSNYKSKPPPTMGENGTPDNEQGRRPLGEPRANA